MSSVELNMIRTRFSDRLVLFWAKFDRWLAVPESCVISVMLANWWNALQFKTRQDKIRQDVLFKALVKRRVIVDDSWLSPNYHQLSPTIVQMVKRQKKFVIVDDRSRAVMHAGRYFEIRIRRVHLSMRTEGIKAFSKRIRRCSVDRWKWYENDKCGRKSFRKWSKTAPFSFENGFVWTGPNSAQFYRTYRLNLHRQLNTVQLRNKRKKFSNKIGSELGSSK